MALSRQIALLAALLAVLLFASGCGGGGDSTDITGEKFTEQNEIDWTTNLDKIGDLAANGQCQDALDKLDNLTGAVQAVPAEIDQGLKDQLVDLLGQLGDQIDSQCEEPDTTTTTTSKETTSSDTTTTVPPTTEPTTTDETKDTPSTETPPEPDNPGPGNNNGNENGNGPPTPPAGGGGPGFQPPDDSGGVGVGKQKDEKKEHKPHKPGKPAKHGGPHGGLSPKEEKK
jgi:hypothetical protein